MKHTIQNTLRQPITIICNSGKALHMAPGYSCEISESDFNANAMVKKLKEKKIIREVVGKESKSSKSAEKEAAPKEKLPPAAESKSKGALKK